MTDRIKTGAKGEQIATDYLKNKGYTILERNWRSNRKEIDIIAEYQNLIVFVEVKTRKSDYYGYPEESVTPIKQEHILQAAEDYILLHDVHKEIRYDIISVIMNHQIQKVYHIEDALT